MNRSQLTEKILDAGKAQMTNGFYSHPGENSVSPQALHIEIVELPA